MVEEAFHRYQGKILLIKTCSESDLEGNFILDKLSPDNKLDVESLTILKDAVSGIKKALPAVKTNVGEYVEVKFNLPFRFNYE